MKTTAAARATIIRIFDNAAAAGYNRLTTDPAGITVYHPGGPAFRVDVNPDGGIHRFAARTDDTDETVHETGPAPTVDAVTNHLTRVSRAL